MHQEAKKQRPPEHQGGCHFEETRFRNPGFRASSGPAAQGTVASPGPVAGSDVTIGPLLMLICLLPVAIDRRQQYTGTVAELTDVLFIFTENLITVPP